ncbi:MAG TPA: hypothetical protein VG755_40325 [Nannocystaceae bacterium]|nr:hypothetical protein [Nannocystaceae bacterium]
MTLEPGSWQHDLVELLRTLGRHDVPFLIVGGYAVAHAGHLRATKDLDVFVPRGAEHDERLLVALSEFLGAPLDAADVQRTFLRLFVGRPGAVDIIRQLPGVRWQSAWSGRSEGRFFGARVPFLGIDALIRNKRAVGRHVDLADVEELVRIRGERRAKK